MIYPNPFRVPAASPLTIDGLVEDSRLKILSSDGSLVRDLATPGGRIGFWDGKDDEGQDVLRDLLRRGLLSGSGAAAWRPERSRYSGSERQRRVKRATADPPTSIEREGMDLGYNQHL